AKRMYVIYMDKEELLSILLKNYLSVSEHLKSVFIFDRDGLMMSSATKRESSQSNEEILGAIAGITDNVLNRIGKEYNLGKYVSGSYETPDFRLIFAEAGSNSIVISVSDYELSLNQVLPYIFLLAEKILRIIEDHLYDGFNVSIPDLGKEGLFAPAQMSNLLGENLQIEGKDGNSLDFSLMTPESKTMRYKLIVLGEAAVGKTSLIDRFASDKFNQDYLPTLGISITEQQYFILNSPESKIEFMIWDLAGQKFFKRARKAYITGASVAFIVYDVTSQASFEKIPDWFADIDEELPNIPRIVVANKIDLKDERVVTSEQGRELANKNKCSYIETSAKTGENVQEAFKLLGIGLFFKKVKEI
ncbi:MAG: GTP-binding protein, partial [Candidatus Lokiarchaeota archaeon]|nr:GTP-binding protein [Candidatus Lokiarchaeota archaeon]